MKEIITRWLLLWIFGNFGMLMLTIARVLGMTGMIGVKIHGFRWSSRDRKKVFPPPYEGLVIYYRHITLFEGLVVPFALYPLWLLGERFVPRSFIADYWLKRVPFLGPACIAVSKDERTKQGTARASLQALRRAEALLDQGRIICIGPTGTRQSHVQYFKAIRKGKVMSVEATLPYTYETLRHEWDDCLIGDFQGGIGWLALHTNAWFMPVWVKKAKPWFIEITYGEPFKTPHGMIHAKAATRYLERKLLELGEGI